MAINLPASFKTRLLAAAVVVPIVIGVTLWFDREILFWVLTAVVAFGLWEWSALAGLNSPRVRFVYVFIGFLSVAALAFYRIDVTHEVAVATAACWFFCVLAVLFYERSQKVLKFRPLSLLLGYVLCLGALLCAPWIAQSGIAFLSLLVVIWSVDSGAYLVGNFIGKHKLHPIVSPNKTWEGAIGGMVVGLLCGIAVDLLGWLELQWFVGGWIVVVVVAVFGDLFESVIKRVADVKDSGTFLPGHGGVLDRLDSVIAVLPFAVLLSY